MEEKEARRIGLIFGGLTGLVLVLIGFSIHSALKDTGISFGWEYSFFTLFTSVIILLWCQFIKNVGIAKVNNYLILAIVLTWIVMYTGLTIYTSMYKTELPIISSSGLANSEDLIKLTKNNTEARIFYPLQCESSTEKKYISKYDRLNCNITTILEGLEYNLIGAKISGSDKTGVNIGEKREICYNSNKGSCLMQVYLNESPANFFLYPLYSNGSEEIIPIFYYFSIEKIRDWKELDALEQNKITLLIAIITASFLTVWSGVYYAKKIIENNKE